MIHILNIYLKSNKITCVKMNLYLFNTMSGKKELFEPINANDIKLYVCGPTTYQIPHIGNFRTFIVFDTLVRLLQSIYSKVTYVRNVTNIDDKIIIEAQKHEISIENLTHNVYVKFRDECNQLNLLTPDHEPHATDYISQMIEHIEEMIKNKYAYVSDEEVLFDTSKCSKYLALAPHERLDFGNRVEINKNKKNFADFVLWKKTTKPNWQSPWGHGRPGWHIECTTMSKNLLSFPFDIHGGGQDLIFPHHTNERAQCYALHNIECAKYWMHNHFITIDKSKMSKSIGNVMYLSNLTKKYSAMSIKLAILMTHYRHPLNWKNEKIQEAQNIYDKWIRIKSKYHSNALKIDIENEKSKFEVISSVYEALLDDLNTSLAVQCLHRAIQNCKNEYQWQKIENSLSLLGIKLEAPSHKIDEKAVKKLIEKRDEARKIKDFATADSIRKQLKLMNIEIDDTKDGTKWKVKC